MSIFRRLYAYKDLLLVFIWREFLIRYNHLEHGTLHQGSSQT